MSDFKSKLPTMKELGHFSSKLFHDLKTSVCEIVAEYKKNLKSREEETKNDIDEKEEPSEKK